MDGEGESPGLTETRDRAARAPGGRGGGRRWPRRASPSLRAALTVSAARSPRRSPRGATPRSQVLSSRLFDWWQGGFVEEGVVLGLVQAAIVLGAFGLAHLLGQRRLVGTS